MTDLHRTGVLNIRPALPFDVSFVVSGILTAERTPGDGRSTYEVIYGLSFGDAQAFLSNCLLTYVDMEHPLSLRSFVVAEHEGLPVGCCAAWTEPVPSSGSLTAIEMSRFLGSRRWTSAVKNVRMLAASTPTRTPGFIQIESVFVAEVARGAGLVGTLVSEAISHARLRSSAEPRAAEVQFFQENLAAERAYERAGFVPRPFAANPSTDFTQLTGSKGFRQLFLPFQQ